MLYNKVPARGRSWSSKGYFWQCPPGRAWAGKAQRFSRKSLREGEGGRGGGAGGRAHRAEVGVEAAAEVADGPHQLRHDLLEPLGIHAPTFLPPRYTFPANSVRSLITLLTSVAPRAQHNTTKHAIHYSETMARNWQLLEYELLNNTFRASFVFTAAAHYLRLSSMSASILETWNLVIRRSVIRTMVPIYLCFRVRQSMFAVKASFAARCSPLCNLDEACLWRNAD